MTTRALALLVGIAALLVGPAHADAQSAPRPDLSSVNWIRGGPVTFTPREFTADGQRLLDAYDYTKDDPALGCVPASWTRAWMNPNVVVKITQGDDYVRLQHEFMDLDRQIPLSQPGAADPPRASIKGIPTLGSFAAWYEGDTLVIDTIDIAPGYLQTMDQWAGLPQSARMHTVERLRRKGDVLTIDITHTDPVNYRTPFVASIEYRKTDWALMEYNCSPEAASIVAPRSK